MSSEQDTLDSLKLKVAIRQCCLYFGARETARKLQGSPKKLEILLNLLSDEGMNDTSYLMGKTYLMENAFETFREKEEFDDLDKANISSNRIKKAIYYSINGDKTSFTKKRKKRVKKSNGNNLNNSQSQITNSESRVNSFMISRISQDESMTDMSIQTSRTSRTNQTSRTSRTTRTTRTTRTNRTNRTRLSGSNLLSISSFNFEKDNQISVSTLDSFQEIKPQFLEETQLGLNMIYQEGKLSTLTLSSEKTVVVLDMLNLSQFEEVVAFIKSILLSTEIEIVTYEFQKDAHFLSENFGIDPISINKILDISEIIQESNQVGNKRTVKNMVKQYFKKRMDTSWEQEDWIFRPLNQNLEDYAALRGLAILRIFTVFDERNAVKGMKYYHHNPEGNSQNVLDFSLLTSKKQTQAKVNASQTAETSKKSEEGEDKADSQIDTSRKSITSNQKSETLLSQNSQNSGLNTSAPVENLKRSSSQGSSSPNEISKK